MRHMCVCLHICVFLPACVCLAPLLGTPTQGTSVDISRGNSKAGRDSRLSCPNLSLLLPRAPTPSGKTKVPGILSRRLDLATKFGLCGWWSVTSDSSAGWQLLLFPGSMHKPGKRQLISVVRFIPPPLWGFCLINLWNSSLSHPQARPAGREFTFWQGETEVRCQIIDVPQSSLVTPVFIISQDSVPFPLAYGHFSYGESLGVAGPSPCGGGGGANRL